jgi:hypothetical protein
MSSTVKKLLAAALLGACLVAGGCGANVGVGVNVGVPIGDHGYVSLGSNRWF